MWIWILYLTLAFILEVVLMALVISPAYLVTLINVERKQVLVWFGEEKTQQMLLSARQSFETHVENTGLKDTIIDMFYIDSNRLRSDLGISDVVHYHEIGYLNQRIDSLWLILEAVFLRIDLFLICLGLSLVFLIPTIVDGLCVWQKQRSSDENASINIYNVAEKTLYFLAILPVYGLFAPFPITPAAIMIWAFIIALCAWFMISNLQHRI